MTTETGCDAQTCGEIVPSGDAAILVRFGTAINPDTNDRVMALLRALDLRPLAGVRDLTPAYASLLAQFDPLIITHEEIEAYLRSELEGLKVEAADDVGELVRVPVVYGGEYGPDLEEVARLVDLSPEEVVRRHAEVDYHVNFLGFLAGFPYMSGLPAEIAAPRLPSPRTQTPAGSVGIAGQQTGIYPVKAPGGWRIIGRTPLRLFDPSRNPPSLLRPGDHVRFEPVPAQHFTEASPVGDPSPSTVVEPGQDATPWMVVRAPGPLTTMQDLGRTGYARYGVSASGAADADALRLGNIIVGNPPDAAALEVTLGGAEFEVLAPCVVAVTGADSALNRNGKQAQANTAIELGAGDIMQIGWARYGARSYVCVSGGAHAPLVLGSRATDVQAHFGGVEGRALRDGDVLWRGHAGQPKGVSAGRLVVADSVRKINAAGEWTIRVLPGPHVGEAAADLQALLDSVFVVSPHSDRVGVRLLPGSGDRVRSVIGGETISEGVPRGVVQVPPNGEPIILLADHQTTGGYRAPAVVATADLWRVAQLRPGNTVRFALITIDEAVNAMRTRAAWLERLASSEAQSSALMHSGHLSLESLMRGFAEWSEEEYDGE